MLEQAEPRTTTAKNYNIKMLEQRYNVLFWVLLSPLDGNTA